MSFFTELEKNCFKFHMEPKTSPYSHYNPKQKEQSWRHHATKLQTILQGYSNKKQHGTGTKTDIQTSGTEQRPQK